ncbi:MAG: beta-lactamase family protein [Spirochaetales bacterium]|nr:beta-lactamase family protein [Spirochaetales bacterium]
MVHGFVAEGYEEVKAEFERNFSKRGELGGAFTAYVDGEKVVDLWGGWADPKKSRPWEEDTGVLVFSATKGVSAMVLAHLHSRGLLDYDERVASYWPEFAAEGKGEITVRQLLSHQGGIVLTEEPLDQTDPEAADRVLAAAKPLWTPGDYQGYHVGTIGFAMAALVRRVDPEHRSVNQYLQEEICSKVGADFSIGLPEEYPDERKAELKVFSPLEALFHLHQIPKGLKKVLFNSKSLFWKTMEGDTVDPNSREFVTGEHPSGNGVGTARGLAALYGEFASGGKRIGLTAETLREVFGPAEAPRLNRLDRVMNINADYGLGFQKPDPDTGWFSPNPRAIGFLGASGALAFADDELGIGAAYVTNRMSPGTQIDDPREKALREALYRCVKGSR